MSLTFGSLFDGIGCFSLGLVRAGLVPSWLVEIEADCRRVTAARFPGVPQFADVRECGGANLPPVDVIVGGFPCQGLSVAGKRGGLADARSGLFWEMVRIVDELRPSLLVFENVPGLFSSDSGRDFARVLRGLADVRYFGAWRVLDAKWFGVPQRRRRIFGVFARGGTAWRRCAEILALAESRERHPPQGRKAGKGTAGGLASSVTGSGGRRNGQPGKWGEVTNNLVTEDIAAAKRSRTGRNGSPERGDETLVTHTLRAAWCDASEDGTGRGTPLAVVPIDMRNATRACEDSEQNRQGCGIGEEGSAKPTLTDSFTPAVAFDWTQGGSASGVVPTLRVGTGLGIPSAPAVHAGMVVRRLTPVECLRLQGLPDEWLDVEPQLSDSAKYRMVGNGGAVPVMEWIGRRIIASLGAGGG